MVMTIKKGSDRKKMDRMLKMLGEKKKKGIDAKKYCGVIKLDKSPIDIQKQMRSEWE